MREDDPYAQMYDRFPKPGSKLRYGGISFFWFTNIIANAERELRIGEIYTLKTIELASSWACITLEETGDTEFALHFFREISETNWRAARVVKAAGIEIFYNVFN